jgi:NhaA family Na+:H+ antiporter
MTPKQSGERRLSILNAEWAPGAALLGAALLSIAVTNSPYADLLREVLALEVGAAGFTLSIASWIKDGAMAVFFFFVGLELKREFMCGELSNPRRAALPLAAAVGGMLAPAAIYVAFNSGADGNLAGWGAPMATDIAFALGALSLLGRRVPPVLKVFLLALAIVDDLGAILVIALFYGSGIEPLWLAGAAAALAGAVCLNRLGVMRIRYYLLFAPPLWFCMHESGVHATLAGVLLALAIPFRLKGGTILPEPPLVRLEHTLREWVLFAIMPIFAFANAGIDLDGIGLSDLTSPVAAGIALGLVIGKPLGILSATLVAARVLRESPPASVMTLTGVGLVAGIGFTMSLFIGGLAFDSETLTAQMRIGVFAGSLFAAVAGLLMLHLSLRTTVATEQAEREAVTPFLVERDERD